MRSGTAASVKATPKQPSERQRNILNAYFVNPSAAAVARALRTHDRHVRRLVKDFAWYLEDRRRARDAEQLERESARRDKIRDWLEATLTDDLERIDELTHSEKDGVALQAIRAKFDLAATFSILPTVAVPGDIGAPLGVIHAELVGKLNELANPAGEGEEAGDA